VPSKRGEVAARSLRVLVLACSVVGSVVGIIIGCVVLVRGPLTDDRLGHSAHVLAPKLNPDSALDADLLWVIETLNDPTGLRQADFNKRFSQTFRDAVLLDEYKRNLIQLGTFVPFQLRGTEERSGPTISALAEGSGSVDIRIQLAQTPEGQIGGLLVTPIANPDRAPFSGGDRVVVACAAVLLCAAGLARRTVRPIASVWWTVAGLVTLLQFGVMSRASIPFSVSLVASQLAIVCALIALQSERSASIRQLTLVGNASGWLAVLGVVATWCLLDTEPLGLPATGALFGHQPGAARMVAVVSLLALCLFALFNAVEVGRAELATSAKRALGATLPSLGVLLSGLSILAAVTVFLADERPSLIGPSHHIGLLICGVCGLGHLLLAPNVQRAELVELQASRQRIIQAEDTARRSVERDLHDGAQQQFLAVLLDLRRLEAQLAARSSDEWTDGGEQVRQTLSQIASAQGAALEDLRTTARGLHPATLDQGLTVAFDGLADRVPMHVTVDVTVESSVDRPPLAIATAAYFVASEAVTNSLRHSGGDAIWIEAKPFSGDHSLLQVSITDNGGGGAPDLTRPAAHDSIGGLRRLLDRVEGLGGSMRVTSKPAGTEVVALLPLAAPENAAS
jgi:signal transduction histidine kinase